MTDGAGGDAAPVTRGELREVIHLLFQLSMNLSMLNTWGIANAFGREASG